MSFWKDVVRWAFAALPICGINYISMYLWKLFIPTYLAYWVGIFSTSPLTLLAWRKIENWKRKDEWHHFASTSLRTSDGGCIKRTYVDGKVCSETRVLMVEMGD